MPSCRLYCGITPRKAGERCRWSLSKAQSVCAAFCAGCSASKRDKKNTGAGGCSGIFCGTSFFCGIGQIQHRAKGVKDEVLDAGCDQQALLLGKQRNRHGIAEQLALTIAQQAAAGASGGLGAGLQLGGIQGICIAGQAAARCGELVQHVVHTAALGTDGGQGDGVVPLGQPFRKGLLVYLLYGEEEGKLLLPHAIDLLGGAGHAGTGRHHQADFVEVGGGQRLPHREVERPGIHRGGSHISGGIPVVHAVHSQAVRYQTVGGGIEPAVRHLGCTPRGGGQCLPQLGGSKHAAAVEQQAPCGIGVGEGSQGGGRGGVVRGGRALLVGNQLCGGLPGAVGVLHQPQAVDEAARGGTPQEQAAGCPVVDVEAAAGKGGRSIQAVGTPGGIEKFLIAGHGTGQGELLEEVVVGTAQVEHQRQRPGGRDSQRALGHLPGQHGGAVFKGRKLHRVGGVGLRPEQASESEHKILGGDGVVSGVALGGGVSQAVLEVEGVGEAVGGLLPPFAEGRLIFAAGIFADKAAVQVLAGDDIRRSRGHLRVKVGRDAVHEPGEAVGARTTAGQGKNKRNGQHHCGKADQGMFQENALLVR